MPGPTFGVNYEDIESLYRGADLSSWETDIDDWVQDASAEIEMEMATYDFNLSAIETAGADNRAYRLCRKYIRDRVTAQAIRAGVLRNVGLAKHYDEEASRFVKRLRAKPEGFNPSFDRDENMGSVQADVDLVTRSSRPRKKGFWASRVGKSDKGF